MIRLVLKVLLAPLIALMTIIAFVLGLMVAVSSKLLAAVSFALAAFAVPVFICGMNKSGCLLLILAWFISPLGLPLIADLLWRVLDNLRGIILHLIL
ncbi:MAG: hypothetical protein IKJ26_02795 [Clostridia bacterium]|nr:hypothetical protein [Clostridia bacterium]